MIGRDVERVCSLLGRPEMVVVVVEENWNSMVEKTDVELGGMAKRAIGVLPERPNSYIYLVRP